MVSVEEDDLAGLEGVSSDGEDDNFEAELTDGDTTSSGNHLGRKPYRKRVRVDNMEPIPLMEGEGKSFRVLGFNQSQRAAFVQILMRFGVGDFDWKEFVPRLKQKTYEEIKDYGTLFLMHIAQDITNSPTFSDGVPKEGLRIQDVLVRIAVLLLVSKKVKSASEKPGTCLFTDDIIACYPTLKGGKFWKEEHDLVLLHAVLKHGYGRWQAIADDKDLRIQEVICQELNLPFINLPVPGQVGSQVQNGANTINVESTGNQTRGTGSGNDVGGEVAQGGTDAVNHAWLCPDSSILYYFRDMQRRPVEYIKKRVHLLEKGLNAEYVKEYYDDIKANEVTSEEPENGQKVADKSNASSAEMPSQVIDHLPPIEVIASEEISAAACNDDADRLELPQHYSKMCKLLEDNVHHAVQSSLNLENLRSLEETCGDISRILSPAQHYPHTSEQPVLGTTVGSQTESQSTAAGSISPPNQQPALVTEIEMDSPSDSEPEKPDTVEEIGIDLTGSDPLKDSSKIVD